jgi:DNA-binding NarL/FixJ family response regulator
MSTTTINSPRIKKTVARLLLVDDHPVVREGVRAFLMDFPDLDVVGEACTGEEALEKTRTLRPDLVLMDINLPGAISGLRATEQIRRELPDIKVMVLTVHDSREYVAQITRVGAHGYLLKKAPPSDLLRAIRTILDGKRFFDPSLTDHLLGTAGDHNLSERETEVLILITRGLTIKEMAEQLGVQASSVQTYRTRIMEKLNIHHVAGLTIWAIASGIISAEPPQGRDNRAT